MYTPTLVIPNGVVPVDGGRIACRHSDAPCNQACLAVGAGKRHIATFRSPCPQCGASAPNDSQTCWKHPLSEGGLSTDTIGDVHHWPTSLLKMVHRLTVSEKLCLIGDAMCASGMAPGHSTDLMVPDRLALGAQVIMLAGFTIKSELA